MYIGMSKVARVVRHDEAGEFIQHDRERFSIIWDTGVTDRQRREHYVWAEKVALGLFERPCLILLDERGRFLGHADVAVVQKDKEFAARFTERYREDLTEMADSIPL